jgi:hypothetical protein
MGNNPTSGTPGAPHWSLAPASMLWQGLSAGELCRVLKNPTLNGNRSPEALIEHMEQDRLVQWGWNPGRGREPVPIAHKEFDQLACMGLTASGQAVAKRLTREQNHRRMAAGARASGGVGLCPLCV